MTQIQLLQRPGLFALFGPSIQVAGHQHHALQLTLGLSAPLNYSVGQEELQGSGFLLAPNTPHQLSCERCLIVLIEPESHLAERLSSLYLNEKALHPLPSTLSDWLKEELKEATISWGILERLFRELDGEVCLERHIEPRLQRLIEWLDELDAKGQWEQASLKSALKQVHLSSSRFLHIFVEQTGISWRRYLRWRRLLSAVSYALAGHSLTESAHMAAFTDSSHFSRVFKEMFGINPNAVIKNIKREE